MTTLQDLIYETRMLLYSNQAPVLNKVSGADLNDSQTNIALQFPIGPMGTVGSIITIDLEHMRVWGTDDSTTLSVDRGVDGTTAAEHDSNSLVEWQPKFSAFMCQRAINQDLDDLASPMNGLFQVLDLEIPYNPAVSGYDMAGLTPSQILAIQEIRYKIPGPTQHLPAIRSFEIARQVPTADYPSGMALLLNESAFPGLPMHVRYRSRFNHLVNLTDDCQTVAGLPVEANGLPALGAAIQLMVGREIKRNFTEATSDPLQLDLVTGGQVLNSYKGLQLQRQMRIQAVQAGLIKQWGMPLRVL
jgi:hypothetical protein